MGGEEEGRGGEEGSDFRNMRECKTLSSSSGNLLTGNSGHDPVSSVTVCSFISLSKLLHKNGVK